MKGTQSGMFARIRSNYFSLEVEDSVDSGETEKDVIVDPRELLAMIAQRLESDFARPIFPYVSMYTMT